MLVLTEPTAQRASGARPAPSTAPSAFSSIGSPSGVPVPCASTYCDLRGLRRRRWRAPRARSASCDKPFGAVSPLVRPSWLTALPRMTA